MIGASGAIAGVLGAYFILFPRANVSTLFIFIIFFKIIKVPAVLILGLWFLVQLLNAGTEGGSVAWYAHVGGFLTGVVLIRTFKSVDPQNLRPVLFPFSFRLFPESLFFSI